MINIELLDEAPGRSSSCLLSSLWRLLEPPVILHPAAAAAAVSSLRYDGV